MFECGQREVGKKIREMEESSGQMKTEAREDNEVEGSSPRMVPVPNKEHPPCLG